MAKIKSTENNNHVRKAPKAYDNKKFIHSSDGRILRLLAEYLHPKQRLDRKEIKKTIIFLTIGTNYLRNKTIFVRNFNLS